MTVCSDVSDIMISIISFGTGEKKEYTADPIYSYVYDDPTAEVLLRLTDGRSDDDCLGALTGGRFFVRNEQPLTGPYIARIMERYDVILPFEGAGSFEPGAFVMRCGELRKFLRTVTGADRHGDAAVGMGAGLSADSPEFASRLRTYIIEKHLRVKCESTARTDPEIWNTGYQRIEVIQKYFDAVLAEYIGLRREAGFDDCFAEDDPYQGDFGGKIPVWICWWQGVDRAPELIRACLSSIERNLPNNAQTVLITQDNYSDYVTLTPAICEKFERGLISVTHLSDILRAELLYRYGGMWIDATYFVSGPVSSSLLDSDLYTLRFDPPLWGMDIQRGRWTLSLLTARKHHPAMQFLMEGLWLYWEQADELVDYFTVDYVCDAGYRHIDVIREAFDRIPPAPPAVYDLQLMMNQRISGKGRERLAADSVLYKINRRNEYAAQTGHGFETYYGYMVNGVSGSREPDPVGIPYSSDGTPVRIPCSSEGDLVRAIREINPELIIDVDGYYERNGRISRSMLDDIILHPLRIEVLKSEVAEPEKTAAGREKTVTDGVQDNGTATVVYSPVYDGVAAGLPDTEPVAEIIIDGRYRMKCYE